MSYTNNHDPIAFRTNNYATADIERGVAVDLSTNAAAAAPGASVRYISSDKIYTGDEITICPPREVRNAVVGETVVAGAELISGSATTPPGKLVAQTGTETVLAIAREGGDDGDTIEVWTL